jgi:glycosidase
MAVVLDWVANHTSWDNPWITAHKEWYAQDASGNIIIPPGTNWQDVAQLNYANTQMRDSMIAAMKSWVLNANVDGFRCDAADRVPYAFWKQALDTIKAMPNRRVLLLAEGSRSDNFTAGFQVNYAWDFYAMLKNVFRNGYTPANLVATHGNEYVILPAGAAKLRFTTNHDETAWDDTPVGLFGGVRGSMSAFVAAAFLGGVPMIYNGQEVGLTVKLPFFSRSPINWNHDPVLFQEYKRLMAFRNGSQAVKAGTLTSYGTGDLLAFVRTSGALQVLVVTNVRNATASFPLPAALAGTTWRDAFTGTIVGFVTPLSLDPYEYRILKNY